jgi:hypothetical protein
MAFRLSTAKKAVSLTSVSRYYPKGHEMTATNTNCRRCKGTGIKQCAYGPRKCFTCRGKGYRTPEEIQEDRAYQALTQDRQAYERQINAFARTLPANYERAIIKYAGYLADQLLKRANGAELAEQAAEIIAQLLDKAGADLIAYIDQAR